MTDGELVRRTLAGHQSAFAELVRRWSARVLAVCRATLRRPQPAEDLAQESLLRAYRALGTLTEPEKFGPWLVGIARRACWDWLKAKQTHQVSLNGNSGNPDQPAFPEPIDPWPEPCDQAAADETHARLWGAVEALPDDQREVILLYYRGAATYQELAELLAVSAATINARLTKARAALRVSLLAKVGPVVPTGPGLMEVAKSNA